MCCFHAFFSFITVTQSIITGFNDIYCLNLLTGNTAVVCGAENDQYRLSRYNLQHGGVHSVKLQEAPSGVTEATFANTYCVAVSYG